MICNHSRMHIHIICHGIRAICIGISLCLGWKIGQLTGQLSGQMTAVIKIGQLKSFILKTDKYNFASNFPNFASNYFVHLIFPILHLIILCI
jgi:hypothetical protein